MSYSIFRVCKRRLVVAALFALGLQSAQASNAPLVSGSYEVLQDTDLGPQTQIRMRIHLVNHGPSDLSIQRMTLWDFSHPEKGGSRACAVTIPAHGSAGITTTQEFTIPRPEYQLWQRGLRPRLVLGMATPGNTPARTTSKTSMSKTTTTTKAVVRLDRTARQTFAAEAK